MKITQGTKLFVTDSRKGQYKAVATCDFDTDEWDFYPVAVDQRKVVKGLRTDWHYGDSIPCRKGIATIDIRK